LLQHFALVYTQFSKPLCSGPFEKLEVIGIINDASGVGVFIIHPDWEIVFFTANFAQLSGSNDAFVILDRYGSLIASRLNGYSVFYSLNFITMPCNRARCGALFYDFRLKNMAGVRCLACFMLIFCWFYVRFIQIGRISIA
jgi:hypothetical protein